MPWDQFSPSRVRNARSYLLEELVTEARRQGAPVPYSANTPYLNTIPPSQEERHPGDRAIEHRIRSLIRWNAVATVIRANKVSSELGGHIASFQSAATLYDVGFMHFWHGATDKHGGDLVYLPGPLLARLLRARVSGRPADRGAVAELPPGGGRERHVLLPASLADARFLAVPDRVDGPRPADGDLPGAVPEIPASSRPRRHRQTARSGPSSAMARRTSRRASARSRMGARERLDNLIFVINCNLQRLDGPVRGNGKIIQELEGTFPRRGLERHQGDLGQRLGSAAREGHDRHSAQAHGGMRRRRVPGFQDQERRLCPRAFLRQVSRAEGDGRRHVGRRDLGA